MAGLEGRQHFVRQQLDVQYQTLMAKHAQKAVDERAQTHLQARCSTCGNITGAEL